MMTMSIEDMAAFCKKKGIVFRSGDIYGGISGFYDFGPYGVEIKNRIKELFWKEFVRSREDVVGIDGAIITNPGTWKASGHVDSFEDLMLVSDDGKFEARADQFLEENIGGNHEGIRAEDVNKLVEKHDLKAPNGKPFRRCEPFNLMFSIDVGPSGGSRSYLRPETAQLIFTNFRLVQEASRQKLPFGIAQIGKAFRNEISPRDFLFRTREFEQFEIEYFFDPEGGACPYIAEVEGMKLNILASEDQSQGHDHSCMTIKDAISKKMLSDWHAYWLARFYDFFVKHGIKPENLRLREHTKDELAHYASACFDIEYRFPFGWKEIHGNADRGSFDLDQHIKTSKSDLSYFDNEKKKKIVPRVIEPSQGIERAFLAFLFDAYHDDKERGNVVLHLDKSLAPVQVAVFPLVNKLHDKAREVFESVKDRFTCFYDKSGSVGRRYARADELGIPYCVTIDFDTLKDTCVTVRERDSTKQKRVYIDELADFLSGLL